MKYTECLYFEDSKIGCIYHSGIYRSLTNNKLYYKSCRRYIEKDFFLQSRFMGANNETFNSKQTLLSKRILIWDVVVLRYLILKFKKLHRLLNDVLTPLNTLDVNLKYLSHNNYETFLSDNFNRNVFCTSLI